MCQALIFVFVHVLPKEMFRFEWSTIFLFKCLNCLTFLFKDFLGAYLLFCLSFLFLPNFALDTSDILRNSKFFFNYIYSHFFS